MAERDRIASVKPALSESRSLFEKLMAREALEAELGELRSQLLEKERGYASLVQKIAELAYDEAAFAQAEKEMDELENVQRRYNDLREKVAQGAVLRKQVADLETRIAENQAGLAQARSEIDRTSFDPQKGAAIEQARAEIETAIRMTEMEMVQNKERLRHAEEKIAEYRKAEKQIEELQLQTAGVLEEIDLLKLTRSLIADYVIYLMQVVRSRIEGEVSRIISEITGGRYEQVLLDEDFNLLVRDIDDDYSIDRFSGGEQDDIAVALRIALSRYLAELHRVHESTVLIFDEIFGSQDEERRNSLLVTLRTQESRFPQIILISHIPEMQGEFANTLFVEMGTDQSSRIKVVE
jgi:DNA repair exonuclease SbcCD ATPase subunit